MNIQIAKKVIEELLDLGVHTFCLCPGGRSAPFVEILSQSEGLEVLSFFEERSACFFALGRARRDQRPVAVITTSGTAVAELLPAVIEAYYSALPLVLITADRPLNFGKKGSPQTLESAIQILKNYCPSSKNICKLEDIDLSDWNLQISHLHLNVCFDEPLLDEKIPKLSLFSLKTKQRTQKMEKLNYGIKHFSEKTHFLEKDFKQELIKRLEIFSQSCKKPLVLIGELRWKEQGLVKNLLNNYKGIFYTEPLSGLESVKSRLLSGENILHYAWKKKEIDGVIRLGGIPRVRFWRDLEKYDIPIFNFSYPPFFQGLARDGFHFPLLESISFLRPYLSSLGEFGKELKNFDQRQLEKWKKILKSYPHSEESWFLTLKKSFEKNSKVFLGNSSPIRMWDKMAFYQREDLHIIGQAGVNGIDGLASRFLGEVDKHYNNVGILGDLSLLYDMVAFWKSKTLSPWTLFVINNFGGQIFSQLFKNPAFLNKHSLSFQSLAKLWDLNYEFHNNIDTFLIKEPYSLVEISPDEEETKACLKKYVSLW